MEQLKKELIRMRSEFSHIITIILKGIVFILTKLNLSHFTAIDKFIQFSNKTIDSLNKYIPKVDENLAALRKKNSANRDIRTILGILALIASVLGVFGALFPDIISIVYIFTDDRIKVFFISVVCFFVAVYLLERRYRCPVCYFEEAKILDKQHLGSTEHYETWRKSFKDWRHPEEHTYKTGTTHRYEYLLKCNCCGHISIFRAKRFTKG